MSVTPSPSQSIQAHYDETPYVSIAFPQSSPEHLCAVATLFGLAPPKVSHARVLELGCASGGNLIPFAARHPDARALGLDLSGVQIAEGQRRIAALDLHNIELRQADIGALDESSLGEFDYIICHGVYSWVPPAVQDAILRIFGRNLSRHGIGYISYNTYPGWKTREIIRDAMLLRGRTRTEPAEQLAYARGMVDFMRDVAPKDSLLAKVMTDEGSIVANAQNYYLMHEFLELYNQPCYFRDFLERAQQHDLAYLAEAEVGSMFASNYSPQMSEPLLREVGHSQILMEQYLDFMNNRGFRQTLVTHADNAARIAYQLDPWKMKSFHIAAHAVCKEETPTLDDTPQVFDVGRQSLVLNHPVAKAALMAYRDAWPSTLDFDTLRAQVIERLDGSLSDDIDTLLVSLQQLLVIRDVCLFRTDPVRVGAQMDERPCVSAAVRKALARVEPGETASVFNNWHETVVLGGLEQRAVVLLDGSKNRDEVRQALLEAIARGELHLLRDGARLESQTAIEGDLDVHLTRLWGRLVDCKLLDAASGSR